MRTIEGSGFLDNFMRECAQLYDISPTMACELIYGSWPILGHGKFQKRDYLRYSPNAREEVVLAMIKCGEKDALMNVCDGQIKNPKFLKVELKLWKEWGLGEFIKDYICDRMYDDLLDNFEVFSMLMDYIDKKLTINEASEWKDAIAEKYQVGSERYCAFIDCIKAHTT